MRNHGIFSKRIAWPVLLMLVSNLRAGEDPGAMALESILAKCLPAGGPGTAVLVAREGKILFSHGYGLADRERQIPATPETCFRIGSVTKQFTAAAILRLAGEHKLSLDDPLSKYFPKYPGGGKITLRHLLVQTSGLHNYTAHPDFMARVIKPISEAGLVAWFQDDPPDFPPGEQHEYSNTNYVLLGQIVEKVSGLPYGEYLQKQFFEPLGMHGTGLWRNATPPEQAARGYSLIEKELRPALDWDMSWAGGAGGIYSTVGDLWRWTEALQGGRVLSPESLHEMTTEGTAAKKETLTRYCMGLYRFEVGWLPTIGHNGGLQGYQSALAWFPEQQATVAILSNAMPGPPDTAPEELLPVAARAFLGPEMAAHAPKIDPKANPATYPDYAGRYDYGSAFQDITVEHGHIFAQLTGQDRFEIYPSGPDAFFFKIAEAGLLFQRDKSGAVTAVTHTQNGTFTALKLSAKDGPAAIPAGMLDAIAGRYQYGPLAVLTVTCRNNQLYAQLTGQPEFPIFPKSDHEFFWKAVPASVEFIRDKDGKITGAVHHQNGITFTAPKLGAK